MPNSQKVEIVKEISEKLAKAKGAYFTDYKGLSVEHANALRSEFFKANIEYKVVKKTLTKIAAKEAGFDGVDELVDGQMGIAFSYEDPVTPAKIITNFVKDNKLETIRITGCIFEKELFNKDKVDYIVKLPSRDELFGKLLGTLNAPMSNLVNVLGASMSNLVGVLESLKEEK